MASPSLSAWPAGRLVYARFDARGATPFTSNTDGTDERQLLPRHAEQPAWAPNGLLLSVAANTPQGRVAIGTVKPDGSGFMLFDLPDSSLNLACHVWSPDGSTLACEGWDDTNPTRNGIYTVKSADGSDATRITSAPVDRHDLPSDYSLDGGQIFFDRSKTEPDAAGDDSHLMVVNVDGTDEHRLSDQLMGGGDLSPDGTTILVSRDIYQQLVPVGGGEPAPIYIEGSPKGIASGGAWSPDGEWIVFSFQPGDDPHTDIYVMRKDGTDLRQVTHTPDQDEEFADWALAPPVAAAIPLEEGCTVDLARCQDMPAGMYETTGRFAFLPGLTVTLPPGWSSPEQDAGEFMLHYASDVDQARTIFFWSDLVPWVDGEARRDLGVSADEFADYLIGDSRLSVVEGPSRTFGVRIPDSPTVIDTVKARSLSVIVSDAAQSDPELVSDCPAGACVNVLFDPDHWPAPAGLGRNIEAPVRGCPCGQAWRLYIASIGGEMDHMFVVAVETVGPDPLAALDAWEAQVEPIIASVVVPNTVVNN